MKPIASKPAAAVGLAALTGGIIEVIRERRIRRARSGRVSVGEAMTGRAVRVGAELSASAAAARMAEEGVGALPVCNGAGIPVGVVTDRDLVVRLMAQSEDVRRTRIGECMEGPVQTAEAGQTLREGARRMRDLRVQQLPVTDEGTLVGMLTLADIARRDPVLAGEVHAAMREARDEPSAAWVFRRPYRAEGTSSSQAPPAHQDVAQLTELTRTILSQARV